MPVPVAVNNLNIQALLGLELPSGQVFPTLRVGGGRMVMPSAQRANGALIPAAIKSTRLVANANRPEGISAFPVSSTTPPTTQTLHHTLYQPRAILLTTLNQHLVWLFCSPQVLVQLVTSSG